MKVNMTHAIALTAIVLAFGCKQEATSTSPAAAVNESASPSGSDNRSPAASEKSKGCTAEAVAGGVQISCGDSTALLNHGTNGTNGVNGTNGTNGTNAPGYKIPVLFDGSPNNGAQPKQIGDYLISVTKTSTLTELITVWIEKEDAILQYENGSVIPRDRAVYYDSNDCSGDGVYQTNPNVYSYALGMGDRIVYWDRYYRLGNEVTHCYPRSKREENGSCTTITGPMANDFNGFVAKPASPGVTTVLSKGYRVKMIARP